MPIDPIMTVSESGDDSSTAAQKATVREFMEKARIRFRTAADASAKRRQEQLYDKKFYASDQWEAQHVAQREADKRPCLTVNRLPGIVRQVTNQSRQAHPAIQINPVDSFADPETAEVFQGVIRQIEIDSDAATAYTTGQENQAIIGIGYWRILTEYRDDVSFEQQVRIKRIRNPFSVYFDPSCVEADYRDANYAFIVEDIPRDIYDMRYGEDISLLSMMEWAGSGADRSSDWMPIGKVRVAEYYYVEQIRDRLVTAQFPAVAATATAPAAPERRIDMRKADLPANFADFGVRIVNERPVMRRLVRWSKINGVGILDGNPDRTQGREWVGKYIPIIPDPGDEIDINGEVDLRGMVRDARGPQRMLNFWASSIAEAVGTAPKSPYLIEAGQLQGLEDYWRNLNTRTFPYLPYKGRSIDGRLVPPPQRQVSETPIQAMVQGYSLAENELRAVTGLYESSLGIPSNERSGTAILARQQRGELGTSNYQDNHLRAIKFTGEQLVDIIPKVYSPGTIMRILGKDEQPMTVMLGRKDAPPSDFETLKRERGITGLYDLSVGKFDVAASVGPTYQSRRQEAAAAMIEMVRAYPNAFPIMGDLMVGNMDWPGAAKIAARIKKSLGITDESDSGIPPEAQHAIDQLNGQLQQISTALQQAQQEIATEAQKWQAQIHMKQMELATDNQSSQADRQSKERIAAIQAQTELIIAQAKIQQDRAETLISAELERIRNLLDLKIANLDRQAAAAKENNSDSTSNA